MRMIMATALAATTLAACASTPPPPPPAPVAAEVGARAVVFRPVKAGYEDVGPAGPYFPERARQARRNGVAVIDCRVAETGALGSCKLVAENPSGLGFGPAALVMAGRGVIVAVPTVTEERIVAQDHVRLRVPFQTRYREFR